MKESEFRQAGCKYSRGREKRSEMKYGWQLFSDGKERKMFSFCCREAFLAIRGHCREVVGLRMKAGG